MACELKVLLVILSLFYSKGSYYIFGSFVKIVINISTIKPACASVKFDNHVSRVNNMGGNSCMYACNFHNKCMHGVEASMFVF